MAVGKKPLSTGDHVAELIATSLYVGEIPVIPGTFGTIPGLFIFVTASMLSVPIWCYFLLVAALYLLGVWAAGRAERISGKKDDGRIVIDEVVGAMITMFYLPLDWRLLVAGFFAFRVFDVAKPGFRRVQKIRGGHGVMIDDVFAGVMANFSLRLLMWFVSLFY
ncbi:MAG: phosphatidylglycerophosphatase A [Candidatus Coatesbacteria bacterium]|nr:phosphatidylglycerophosphatase A [Candidatus Coatesbacteria bacterium]